MKKNSRFGKLGLIVTDSVPSWGQKVAEKLGVTPLEIESKLFENGELNVRRLCDVSGMDICILSSLHSHYPTIEELKLICGTLNASPARMFGVFPFIKCGKSDHVKQFGEYAAYKNVAMDISMSGLETVAIFDQHSGQHPNFYNTRNYRLHTVHHLYLIKILIEYVKKNSLMFDSILAPDEGGFKRNSMIAKMLNKNLSYILKYRNPNTKIVEENRSSIIGEVKGHRVAVFDDMIQGGGTMETSAKIAKDKGAKEINFFAVHNDFSLDRGTFNKVNSLLESGLVDKIFILETIPLRYKGEWHKNLMVISPEDFIVEVIRRIHFEGHMRELFLQI